MLSATPLVVLHRRRRFHRRHRHSLPRGCRPRLWLPRRRSAAHLLKSVHTIRHPPPTFHCSVALRMANHRRTTLCSTPISSTSRTPTRARTRAARSRTCRCRRTFRRSTGPSAAPENVPKPRSAAPDGRQAKKICVPMQQLQKTRPHSPLYPRFTCGRRLGRHEREVAALVVVLGRQQLTPLPVPSLPPRSPTPSAGAATVRGAHARSRPEQQLREARPRLGSALVRVGGGRDRRHVHHHRCRRRTPHLRAVRRQVGQIEPSALQRLMTFHPRPFVALAIAPLAGGVGPVSCARGGSRSVGLVRHLGLGMPAE